MGDFDGALAALAAISAESPNGEPGRQAQLDWIQTRGQNGDSQGALDAYREFAAAYPDDPRAPEALARAVDPARPPGRQRGRGTAAARPGAALPQQHTGPRRAL